MKSIKSKLVIYFTCLIILSSSILGFLLINRSRNVIIGQADYGHPNVPLTPSYVPASDRVLTTQCQPMYQPLNPFSLITLLSQRVCYI